MNNETHFSGFLARCGKRFAACLRALSLLAAAITVTAAPAPAPLDQAAPAIATGNGVTLAVWQDSRNGAEPDIYGARLDAAGQVLSNFAISVAPGSQVQPAVACNGTDFLVVWADYRNGDRAAVYAARVTAAGEVLDSSGFPVLAQVGSQLEPAVASDGTGYLVVWQEGRFQSVDIFGARVSANGTVLEASPIVISQAVNNELNPAVAGGPAGYLVVWQDYRSGSSWDAYGTLVSSAGVVLAPAGLSLSTAPDDQLNPAVSADSAGFMVVWQDFRNGSHFDIYGTRLGNNGVVNNPAGVAISAAANDQTNPSLTWNGTGHLVTWADGRANTKFAVYAARLTSAGAISDAAGLLLNNTARDQYHPAAAGISGGFWVAWQDLRSGVADVYGARVAASGAVSDSGGVLISTANSAPPPSQQTPVVSWPAPAGIQYGAALSSAQLNATANVPGTFQYSPSAGAVLTAGNHVLSVTFTPSDTQTYKTVTATASLMVNRAPLTIRADDKSKVAGQPNPSLTATYQGFVNGDSAASLTTPVSLATTATVSSPAGTYPITVSGASSPNYSISFVNGTLTVTPSLPSLASLAIQAGSTQILTGQTCQFSAIATYSDGTTAVVTSGASWTSSNPSVASINGAGLATGLAAGTTTITASFGGKTATASLSVTSSTTPTTRTFANSGSITVRDANSASVYPSAISVSGLSGSVARVTVKLSGLTHKRPDDLDILLVGPGGQKVLLMSDAGGSEDIKSLTLVFDDAAGAMLSDKQKLAGGTFRPSNYGGGDTFKSPAPAGPYAATLAAFKGASSNGNWQLHIMDDASGDAGSLAGGWSLTITTQ